MMKNDKDNWKIALRSELIDVLVGESEEKRQAFEKIGRHYQCSAPASLYKYYGDEKNRFDLIRTNKVWYSSPTKFNDEFDCEITIDEKAMVEDALKLVPTDIHIRPGSQMWNMINDTMHCELHKFRDVFANLRTTTGVSCFSESNDSLLMWAHYANNHRGICVEYDLMEINRQLGFTPVPIIYSDERVCFQHFNIETIENDSIKLLLESLTTKSIDWSYEREWRIIREKEACGNNWQEEKKGALLNMIQPSSIILGCASTIDFYNDAIKYCKENKITLYKMEKDPNQYQLNKALILEFGKTEY